MSYATSLQRLLLAGGLAATAVLMAKPLDNSYQSGVFKRSENEPKPKEVRPLTGQKLTGLAYPNQFQVTDSHTGESFTLPAMAGYPVDAATKAMDLKEDLPDDGKTLVAPVDLTGSGVSDLLYARKEWGNWKVLSNGGRMPTPFEGFVPGLVDRGQSAARTEQIPAITYDLDVDHDLLTVVGDFLGNGTEQLAYTRPGWTHFWVVGAHGTLQMSADLTGIESGGSGPRVHWLFAFQHGKGARHTSFAYYRMGCDQLITFKPKGMTFVRGTADLKENWHKLCGRTLEWPREAPGALERAKEEGKEIFDKVTGNE